MTHISDRLKDWLNDNEITYRSVKGDRIYIDGLGYAIEFQTEGNIINSSWKTMALNIKVDDANKILDNNVDHVIYEWGGDMYYSPTSEIFDVKLKELKDIGEYQGYLPEDNASVFLGVHGRYEVMSGTRDYSDWCKKAKFYGYKHLGICESNTLAGTLPFQLDCKKNGINPIIGYTVSVQTESGGLFDMKFYPIDQKGWEVVLKVNKIINVDIEDPFITEQQLYDALSESGSNNICCILVPGEHITTPFIEKWKPLFEKTFFQITTNEYQSPKKDLEILKSMKRYLDKYSKHLDPILISDAYCIDNNDTHIKGIMAKQGKINYSFATKNHYLKSFEDMFIELEELFNEEDERMEDLFLDSIAGLEWVVENCKFQIETNKLFLPSYEMTKAEAKKYVNKETLFDDLIRVGVMEKYHEELNGKWGDQFHDDLWERIEVEYDIINRGGFIDYFLILYDIVKWCDEQKIEVGPGRGSAAGCVISYLLGIVKIDPLRFNLLFERFLNEGRIQSELPDIDIDFASDRRDEVIEYMRDRYGHDHVCRVGTYGTLKMKGVIQELSRIYGVNGDYKIQVITKLIDDDNNDSWGAIFEEGMEKKTVKSFIKDNPQIIADAKLMLNSIKSTSVHACATIIVPKMKGKNIFNHFPVRKDSDTGELISEWEGDVLADAGFLKEDILSTRQMAKIGHIIDLIEKNHGKRINTEHDIPLDDDNVFKLFCDGRGQDVFQFHTKGLIAYMKEVQPENIEDLIAVNALYRPGAMKSDAHKDFVKLRRGEKEPEYDYMLQSVTERTQGLYIYQEQVMEAVRVLGGFSLTEADGVRKAMGKKIQSKMDGYKKQFLEAAVNKGCEFDEALKIWNKLEVFSGYGFNKSHAAAYSVIGYYCNWFKYYYPTEFWTVAFQFARDHEIEEFVAEVKRIGTIEIVPPDINKSSTEFRSEGDKIYWNLEKIKYVGAQASTTIIEERDENGKFFDIEEFAERCGGSSVNIRTIQCLVLAGCFDEMYAVSKASDRYRVMRKYYDTRKEEMPEEYVNNKKADHYWSIKQHEISKLSHMDYTKLIKTSEMKPYIREYVTSEEFSYNMDEYESKKAMIVGTVSEVKIKKTKKKKEFAVVKMIQDEFQMGFRMWESELLSEDPRLQELIKMVRNDEKPLIIVRGDMSYNDFTKSNEITIRSSTKGKIFESFST